MKFIVILLMILGATVCVPAQEQKYGSLSGGFETNTIYYVKDAKTGAMRPDDHLGSNNYLKFDYRWQKFSAGLMYEAYIPVIQGFSNRLNKSDIVLKYAAFEDRRLKIRVGDFYEQFGSGLIFRAYEDRSLGLNTSVEGVRLEYTFRDLLTLKGIYGHPRQYMERASSAVRGVDFTVNLAAVAGMDRLGLQLGGSFVNRYEEYTGSQKIEPNTDVWAGRLALLRGGFSFRAEYAGKALDKAVYNDYADCKGNALSVDIGYVRQGMGIQFNLRRLQFMNFRSSRESVGFEEGLNYLPALTRQHTYALANIRPYAVQGNGEIGGQVDLYYNFRKHTLLGGDYGLKVQANFSAYYNLKGDLQDGYDFLAFGKELLFRDLNFDFTKKWSPAVKSVLFYSMQEFNPTVLGHPSGKFRSHALVGDVTFRLSPVNSLRAEVQHLWTRQDERNWLAFLVEFNVAPNWSFFVSDMYNYGTSDLNYYNGGLSYSVSRTRVALNYGRSRAGYQCSGGVCRDMPAYTGLNLVLTSSF